ncbi:hypothetical protein ACIP4S_13135 [Streptomyces chartreusis]|uniref:hypothetical protein n=1 Tax=Streptomyces chartreusis TaxID=1969 RepID=UPI003808109D
MTDELIAFVRASLADDVRMAREIGNVMVTQASDEDRNRAEVHARRSLEAAEAAVTLFEETIRPYLGTAGPTGRIAEQQLRIMACMFADHAGFKPEMRL